MRAACCEATVLRHEVIAEDIRLLTVLWPDREHIPHAGQFFTLRAWGADEAPFLSRPISVHKWDAETQTVEFLYAVVGEGTRKLTALMPGDSFQLTGPMGNGFDTADLLSRYKKIAVVGSSLPMMPPKISRTIFEAVSEALFRELKLEIEYDSASGKQVKSLITPLGLVQQDVRLYLVCMFDRYENVRHLALHRLTKARVTEFQAERPKDFSLDSYVNSCHFNYSDGSGRKVELSFRFTNAVTALNLNETPFNRTQRLEKLPDGSFHLSVILTDSPLIDGWIAVWKDKAGISELTRTPVTGSGIAPQDY